MTKDQVAEWLAERRPAPPAELAERLRRALASFPEERLAPAATMTEAMAALGRTTLAAVAGRQDPSTDHALNLLAADAFVTYLFEAAAEEDVDMEPVIAQLLREVVA